MYRDFAFLNLSDDFIARLLFYQNMAARFLLESWTVSMVVGDVGHVTSGSIGTAGFKNFSEQHRGLQAQRAQNCDNFYHLSEVNLILL